MKIIDLTHTIHPNLPVFPGTPQPEIERIHQIDTEGYAETHLQITSHLGTHMDAPAHMIQAGATLDIMDVGRFAGRAILADVRKINNGHIQIKDLQTVEAQLPSMDFLILYTGWEIRWGQEYYFEDFPALSPETAEWLLQFNLKGIGMDTISIDKIDSNDFPIHRILLSAGWVIIENLTQLGNLPNDPFDFYALPLKFTSSDGAPVRAIARV